MIYDVTYSEMKRICNNILDRGYTPKTGEEAENDWLWDIPEEGLQEAERLNVLLPLIKWEIEHDLLTEWMSDELYLYYEDYTKGKLGGILAEYEADAVIHDLTECFNKVFPDGLED